MVQFRRITEENFPAILDLKQKEGQHFVPSNARSLAQAWLYYENHDVYSFAVYAGETPVGFMQLYEEDDGGMFLWRVMIDRAHQGKGYGRAAVAELIRLVRESGKYPYLGLGCKPENAPALHIYESLGFRFTGEVEHGEKQYRLELAGENEVSL